MRQQALEQAAVDLLEHFLLSAPLPYRVKVLTDLQLVGKAASVWQQALEQASVDLLEHFLLSASPPYREKL